METISRDRENLIHRNAATAKDYRIVRAFYKAPSAFKGNKKSRAGEGRRGGPRSNVDWEAATSKRRSQRWVQGRGGRPQKKSWGTFFCGRTKMKKLGHRLERRRAPLMQVDRSLTWRVKWTGGNIDIGARWLGCIYGLFLENWICTPPPLITCGASTPFISSSISPGLRNKAKGRKYRIKRRT